MEVRLRLDAGGWGGSFNHEGWCGGCDGGVEVYSFFSFIVWVWMVCRGRWVG